MHFIHLNRKIMSNNICWYQKECVESMNRAHDASMSEDTHPHFKAFTDLLDLCGYGKLLDIGTGTARISQFCKNFEFVGADLPNIISGCAMRNYPKYKYQSIDIIEDNLAWIREYDVIVLNGVIDVMQNGLYILERILTHSRRYVLIHRQEITESGKTYSKINPSYNSNTFHSIINRNDFNQLLEKMGFEIVKENSPGFTNWENGGSSFLLKNKVKDMTKYESHPLRQLKNRILQANPLKVVIGGGDIMHDTSWIVTNQEEIDAELKDDFEYFFESKNADNFFASHVFEHLKDVESAVINIYNSLKIGGKLRIAVPDGYFPDEKYINEVKVGGTGAGSDDHKHLFNIDSLSEILTKYGFKVEPIEYWKDGKFNKKDWSANDGFVGRSAEYDERNINGELKYTSLIIDCYK